MNRLEVRVTKAQYDALVAGGNKSAQVRELLGLHFGLPLEEGDEATRVFDTFDGDMTVPHHIMAQVKVHADRNHKIGAIKCLRVYCSENYASVRKPGREGFWSRFGLLSCKSVCDTLWAEWGVPTPGPPCSASPE